MKQNSDKLHKSIPVAHEILDIIAEPIAFIDTNYCYQYINNAYCTLYQKEKHEIAGRCIAEFIGQDVFESYVKMQLDKCLRGENAEYRFDWMFPDGKQRTFLMNYYPHYNEQQQIDGCISSGKSIPPQQQMNIALQESFIDLQLVQKISNIGNWKFDPAIGTPVWSDEVYHIYRRDPKLGPPHIDEYKKIYTPDQYQIFYTAIQAAIKHGKPYDIELQLNFHDGEKKWLRVICQPDKEKRIHGHFLRGTIQDISDRKKTEIALQESKEKYKRLFNNSNSLIMEIDADSFKVINCNASMAYAVDSTPPKIIGKNIKELFPEEILERRIYFSKKALKENKIQVFEDVHNNRHFLNNYIPVFTNNKRYIQTVTYDITKRKISEIELIKSQRILSQVEKIAHIGGWEWDLVNDKFRFSDEWLRIHGIQTSEINSKDLMTIAHPDDRDTIRNALNKAFTKFVPYNLEHRIINQKTKKIHFIQSIGEVIYNETGKPVKMFGTAQDITQRKKTEQALENSTAKYKRLMQRLPDIVYIYSIKSGAIFWSEQIKQILKFSPNECRKNPHQWTNAIHKEDINFVKKTLAALNPGDNINIEYRIFDANGNMHWFNDRAFCIENEKGELLIEGIATDITKRKKAEQALRESEENFRYILKYNPNAIAVYDKNLYYLMVSDRYLSDYKVSEENIIGKHHYEVFSEIPERWRKIHQRTLQGEVLRNDDDFFYKDDGSIIYNRWECRPWYTANGEIGGMITYTEVITQRKLAEQALRESEEKFRLAIEATKDGIWDWNVKNNKVIYSPPYYKMLGFSNNKFMRNIEQWKKLIHPNDRDTVTETNRKCINGDIQSFAIEYRMKTQKGHWLWILGRGKAISRDKNGKALRIIGTHTNIDERKQAEIALKESEKELKQLNITKDKLFSIIGHDLKNPISNTLGIVELLKNRYEKYTPDKILTFIHHLYDSTLSTSDLLNNLLTWSRSQRKAIKVKAETIYLQNIVDNCIITLQTEAKNKQIYLINAIANHIQAYADSNMINTVVRNLISNAIKFTNRNGRVIIDADYDNDMVVVEIMDTGIGMDTKISDKLFDFDETFTSQGTDGEKGTGLGLIICKEFVEQNQGKIWVKSHLGKGSTFYFSLPVAPANQ